MKNKHASVIGIDFGTDSVRAILADTDDGTILAESAFSYPRWAEKRFCDPGKAEYRQHPLDYLEGLEHVVKEILSGADTSRVKGIGVDTTGSTPCAVDAAGTPLALHPEFADDPDAMFLLWKDHTAAAEADDWNAAAGKSETDYREFCGERYSSEWFWSKILHVLRNNPRVGKAAFSWVEHCDWIPGELAGNTLPASIPRSRCAAGHKAMWHEKWGGLPPDAFLRLADERLAGIGTALYTNTRTAEHPVGHLSPGWAAKFGLSENVVIAGGGFDCHFGAVGANIQECELVKVMGTSSCDILVAAPPVPLVPGICGQVDGSVLPGMTGLEAGQSAFGDIFAWCARLFGREKETLEALEKEAASIAPGADGVLAVDWFNGRRSPYADPSLRGVLAGLDISTTPAAIYRALVEGACFGARKITGHFLSRGFKIESVKAIGGIAHKSPFVMQLCADILDKPLKIVKSGQTCALGGAMFAAAAAGIGPIREVMAHMDGGIEKTYRPNPARTKVYEKLYRRYERCSEIFEKERIR